MKKLLGGLLNGCGILIAGTTGLCAGILILASSKRAPWRNFVDTLQVTGFPMGVGILMIIIGQALIRSSRNNGPD